MNAVAHRNYASKSGVQVMLFANRLEVWNPGGLPEDLTVDQLRIPHPSVPRNRLICEPLFLAHYIERAGTGTLDMIRLCAEVGLPEPEFRNEGERFVSVIWRDWLTEEIIDALMLNNRQVAGLKLLNVEQKITTMAYQKLVGCSRRTAARDLDELIVKGVIDRKGAGRGAHYIIQRNRAVNVPIVP